MLTMLSAALDLTTRVSGSACPGHVSHVSSGGQRVANGEDAAGAGPQSVRLNNAV